MRRYQAGGGAVAEILITLPILIAQFLDKLGLFNTIYYMSVILYKRLHGKWLLNGRDLDGRTPCTRAAGQAGCSRGSTGRNLTRVGPLESCVLPLSNAPSRALMRRVCGTLWPMDYLQSAPISRQCRAINSSPICGASVPYSSYSLYKSSAS